MPFPERLLGAGRQPANQPKQLTTLCPLRRNPCTMYPCIHDKAPTLDALARSRASDKSGVRMYKGVGPPQVGPFLLYTITIR